MSVSLSTMPWHTHPNCPLPIPVSVQATAEWAKRWTFFPICWLHPTTQAFLCATCHSVRHAQPPSTHVSAPACETHTPCLSAQCKKALHHSVWAMWCPVLLVCEVKAFAKHTWSTQLMPPFANNAWMVSLSSSVSLFSGPSSLEREVVTGSMLFWQHLPAHACLVTVHAKVCLELSRQHPCNF